MGTRYKGEPEQVRALDAYIKLTRASESLVARLARGLARQGLTTGQLGILEALLHLGPMCQLDLGRKLLRSGGNITTVIDNLERRELVRRERSFEDRRFVLINLTPAGRRLIEKVFPKHARAISDGMAALSATEQVDLGRLCRKLGRAVAGG